MNSIEHWFLPRGCVKFQSWWTQVLWIFGFVHIYWSPAALSRCLKLEWCELAQLHSLEDGDSRWQMSRWWCYCAWGSSGSCCLHRQGWRSWEHPHVLPKSDCADPPAALTPGNFLTMFWKVPPHPALLQTSPVRKPLSPGWFHKSKPGCFLRVLGMCAQRGKHGKGEISPEHPKQLRFVLTTHVALQSLWSPVASRIPRKFVFLWWLSYLYGKSDYNRVF